MSDNRELEEAGPTPSQSLTRTLRSKYQQAFRLFALNYLSRRVPYLLVTEFPKSGGTWLGQLISGYTGLPFPRNEAPSLQESVLHGHYLPGAKLDSLRRIFWLLRDGRDVLVSHYHHLLIWNERNARQPKEVLYHRRRLRFEDYGDVRANLPAFIDFAFTHRPSRLHRFTFMGDWATFNEAWLTQDRVPADLIVRTRYEDLLENTKVELARVLGAALDETIDVDRVERVVEDHSFERLAGRKPGQEEKSSFLRKGIAGDWKNYFSREAAEVFDQHAGSTLVRLGYEADRSWVDRVP